MPLPPAPRPAGDARAAVAQVQIARAREQLCEACVTASALPSPTAVSLRVEGTDLFVITPDATDLSTVGPAQTSLLRLDGTAVSGAWDRRTRASADADRHAESHRATHSGAVATRGDALRRAAAPAEALAALHDASTPH
ncbi:class II aldolase/adducin family protein [Microbacterium sp. NPDC089318]